MWFSGAGEALACRRRKAFSVWSLVFLVASCVWSLFRFSVTLVLTKCGRRNITKSLAGDLFSGLFLNTRRSFSLSGKIISHLQPKIYITEEGPLAFIYSISCLQLISPTLSSSISSLILLQESPESGISIDLDRGFVSSWFTNLVRLSISSATSLFEKCLPSGSHQCLFSSSIVLGRTLLQERSFIWAWPTYDVKWVTFFFTFLDGPTSFKSLKPIYFGNEFNLAYQNRYNLMDPVKAPFVCFLGNRRFQYPPVMLMLPTLWKIGLAGDSAQSSPLYHPSNFLMLMFFTVGCLSEISYLEKRKSYLDQTGLLLSSPSSKEKELLPISSHWERSFPPSSRLRERTFPPLCLCLGIGSYLIFKLRTSIVILSDLLSYVETSATTEAAIGILSSIPLGLDVSSKSHDADIAVTTLLLTIYRFVRSEFFLASRISIYSDSFVNVLSNLHKFVSLSTICCSFLALSSATRLAYRGMSDTAIFFVNRYNLT